MLKRGQVTVFIILGIVVVSIVGFVLYIGGIFEKEDFTEEELAFFISTRIEPVKDIIEGCVAEELVSAVTYVSNHGGYYSPLENEVYSFNSPSFYVSYSWNVVVGTRLPTLTGLGFQLNLYMNENLENIYDCIDNGLEEFENEGLDLSNQKNFELEDPIISMNKISQKISYFNDRLFSIKKADYVATVSGLTAEVEIPLGQAQSVASSIVNCFVNQGSNLPSGFNTYCYVNGIPFNIAAYSLQYPTNIISLNHQSCGDVCNHCYYLEIPFEQENIQFNVMLKEC